MSRAVVLRPASSALLSRYEMCKWLCRGWQGATSINTSVSAQRICPQVRIFIKNEWVSISLHSFGSFPPKQIVALRQGCKDTQHQSRARRLDQTSWVHAVLPAPPGWLRWGFKVVAGRMMSRSDIDGYASSTARGGCGTATGRAQRRSRESHAGAQRSWEASAKATRNKTTLAIQARGCRAGTLLRRLLRGHCWRWEISEGRSRHAAHALSLTNSLPSSPG